MRFLEPSQDIDHIVFPFSRLLFQLQSWFKKTKSHQAFLTQSEFFPVEKFFFSHLEFTPDDMVPGLCITSDFNPADVGFFSFDDLVIDINSSVVFIDFGFRHYPDKGVTLLLVNFVELGPIPVLKKGVVDFSGF